MTTISQKYCKLNLYSASFLNVVMELQTYTLEWLEITIHQTLNPAVTDPTTLTEQQLNELVNRAETENLGQQYLLKKYTFLLFKTSKIRILVSQYHTSLVSLLDRLTTNMTTIDPQLANVVRTCECIVKCINEILIFIEKEFGQHIASDHHLPQIRLNSIRTQIETRMKKLKPWLSKQHSDSQLLQPVINVLDGFVHSSKQIPWNMKKIEYLNALISGLEKISLEATNDNTTEEITKLLVYLNFNSRAFFSFYTASILSELEGLTNLQNKLSLLLLKQKQLGQSLSKPGIKLNLDYPDLKELLANWFEKEINYVEKEITWTTSKQTTAPAVDSSVKSEPFKVVCFMSTDQIALILRSMDALRIIQARSLSAVIASIAPFLSTPRKVDISADGLRSKSYSAEDSDKLATIKILESIIEWIRQY